MLADDGEVDALRLLYEQTNGPRRVYLFLAMLEAARDRRVELIQLELFGPIVIRKLCSQADR